MPRIVPLTTAMSLLLLMTPKPEPVGLQLTGFPEHTVGPCMAKPFRSSVTLSAVISMAVVLSSGTVRFPVSR